MLRPKESPGCSRSKCSHFRAIATTCRRTPSSAVPFRTVIEPQDTSVAFAMSDEVEVALCQKVCNCFCNRSQERLDCLFAVDTSHMKVSCVVRCKRHMSLGICQEPVKCGQRGPLSGLSILNGRQRDIPKFSCFLK